MQKYSKISLIAFLLPTVIILLYSSIALYIHDPLMIWHKPFFRKNLTYSTMRESAISYIRDYDFDSAIFGSSYSENTSSKSASDILNGKFFNLSMSGSTNYEKNLLMNYLLKHKKIKQILYLSDIAYFTLRTDSVNYSASNYDFLYNDDKIDDYKIYLNYKYLPCSLIFSNSENCIGSPKDIDKPYAWEKRKIHYERFGGFDVWLKHKDNDQLKQDFERWLKLPDKISDIQLDEDYKNGLKKYLEDYLFSTVRLHPETKFYIIISPVSDIELSARLRDTENYYYKKYNLYLKYLTEENLKNLEVYAFDDMNEIGKIENYKDATHYKTDINNFILTSVAKKKHLITDKNVDEYLDKVYQKAVKFDFKGYIEKIRALY